MGTGHFGTAIVDGEGESLVTQGAVRFRLNNDAHGVVVGKISTETIGDTGDLLTLAVGASATLADGGDGLEVSVREVGVTALSVLYGGARDCGSIGGLGDEFGDGSDGEAFLSVLKESGGDAVGFEQDSAGDGGAVGVNVSVISANVSVAGGVGHAEGEKGDSG
ncbi:hypothetical protein FGB62_130g015 [Gracilaria domingensis]|nr:hypothetical protein FGB62_130g015 [Gracilaria domingensis]